MNTVLKIFLSMSFSGGLLILALLLGKKFLKNKISRQWQYYIWLVVILRLLLPFGLEVSLLGNTYQAVDQAITQTAPLPSQQPAINTPGNVLAPAVDLEQNNENVNSPSEDLTSVRPLQDIGMLFVDHVWLAWLVVALALLIRKATTYQGFMRYIHAGLTPVSDIELLDRLSIAAEQSGIKKPVELCVDPLVSSPLLIGFFRPCIVLPNADISEKDFQYIALHELTHYRRRDMFYKWLVQVTVCLHWFNPLVYLMGREVTKACEFSCDEAVMTKMGCDHAQDYGKTLLDAMAAVGKYQENPGAVTLSENKQMLKERLGAIMNFKRKSKAVRLLTGALTLCMILGAAFVGVYPAAASNHPSSKPTVSGSGSFIPEGTDTHSRDYSARVEQYYKSNSLPLLQIAFPQLDAEEQLVWLEKIYADNNIAFFSVAVRGLDKNSSVLASFAERVYENADIVFFSTLADIMDETELELWLERALEDGNWAFQSMLLNKLDKEGEFNELEAKREKEWAEAQMAEYEAVGVTMVDEKTYYYQGQLVNIFLDIRKEGSFYTLNMNPAGTVNIKITRDADSHITGVAYMTEAEVTELLEDMSDDDDDWQKTAGGRIWHPQVIPVNYETMADGKIIWLGEYTLSEGDRIWYDVSAETGNGLQVGFAKPGDTDLNTTYYSVKNLRQKGETLECTSSFIFGPSAKPGTYKLFLRATDGALGNVKGSISIGFIADAS